MKKLLLVIALFGVCSAVWAEKTAIQDIIDAYEAKSKDREIRLVCKKDGKIIDNSVEISDGTLMCVMEHAGKPEMNTYAVYKYENGKILGNEIVWYYNGFNSGKIAEIDRLENGEPCGDTECYNKNGKLTYRSWTKNGYVVKYIMMQYTENGKLSGVTLWSGKRTIDKIFHDSGRLAVKTVYNEDNEEIKYNEYPDVWWNILR